ncbi:carbohydrate ABC transporter permease [Paucibacter sp. B2R-40]|uniref:carbohydrate ABC transporter permease n=1 Tax=Paucibacter sp. B2R-40 TaxID=2893554 RepID=UPI0021E387A5|nr:carbohydrate ABC transporter permease [Paucibacter sp. B2R-40]MCV2356347.1 carbohydrate ABC transporter permease [Paucibacter sp. B2R-40]
MISLAARSRQLAFYSLMLLLVFAFAAPLYWTLLTALKAKTELYAWPPIWWPAEPRWSNFAEAWGAQPFALFLRNSLWVALLSTVGQIFSSSLVAYGFARFDFKGRNALFMIVLGSMMIPWDVSMIPLYMEFNALGWINTLKPLIVPSFFAAPFFIFLLRQFIMSIPRELDEAARMDGANAWQIYWRIHLPLMAPALVLVGTFQFLGSWNDYLGPLIFLNDQSLYTLALGLAQFKGLHSNNVTAIAAMTVLLCLPPLLLFFLAQRHIMDGATSAAVKG